VLLAVLEDGVVVGTVQVVRADAENGRRLVAPLLPLYSERQEGRSSSGRRSTSARCDP
jgi:hypothetical protein